MKLLIAGVILFTASTASAQSKKIDFSNVTCANYEAFAKTANSGTIKALEGAMALLFLNGYAIGVAAGQSDSVSISELMTRMDSGELPKISEALDVCEGEDPDADFYEATRKSIRALIK